MKGNEVLGGASRNFIHCYNPSKTLPFFVRSKVVIRVKTKNKCISNVGNIFRDESKLWKKAWIMGIFGIPLSTPKYDYHSFFQICFSLRKWIAKFLLPSRCPKYNDRHLTISTMQPILLLGNDCILLCIEFLKFLLGL